MYQYRIDFLKDSKGMNMGLVHVLPACMYVYLTLYTYQRKYIIQMSLLGDPLSL